MNRTGLIGDSVIAECCFRDVACIRPSRVMNVLLKFRRGKIAQRFEQPIVVDPLDPRQRRELHVFEVTPGAAAVNHPRLE